MINNEPRYVFENNCYDFYIGENLRFTTDEVAVLFDKNGYVLHKHGLPEVVEAMYHRMVKAFNALGYADAAADLVLIQGKFDVEELNKTVTTSNYVRNLYESVVEISV